MGIIWQGFHHRWGYNHRINRLGSFVTQKVGDARLIHTAASGLGKDSASFTGYATRVESEAVTFLPAEPAVFDLKVNRRKPITATKRVEIQLNPDLRELTNLTALINGFDIVALDKADKIRELEIAVGEPEIDELRWVIRCDVQVTLGIDCQSLDCSALDALVTVWRRTNPDAEAEFETFFANLLADADTAAYDLLQAIEQSTDLTADDEVDTALAAFSGILEDEDAFEGVFDAGIYNAPEARPAEENTKRKRRSERRTKTYQLTVYPLVLAAKPDAYTVQRLDTVQHRYDWGANEEVSKASTGSSIAISAVHDSPSTFAFKRFSLDVSKTDGRCTAPHLLQLDVALRDQQIHNGQLSAVLDLYFGNWRKNMRGIKPVSALGALRDEGMAEFEADIVCLNFAEGQVAAQSKITGEVHWPGGSIPSKDRRAVYAEDL